MGRNLKPEYTTWHLPQLEESSLYNEPSELKKLKKQALYNTSFLAEKNEAKAFIEKEITDFNFQVNKFIPSKNLSNLILEITTCCNLNCKGCTAYSPLSSDTPAARNAYSAEAVLRDLECLKSKGIKIREISVEGGEPFLHPNLMNILKNIRKVYSNTVLIIQTNGLLLNTLKDENYRVFQETECQIIVNNYFKNLNLSIFLEKAQIYGIEYTINSCYSEDGYFFIMSRKEVDHFPPTKQDLLKQFSRCEKAHDCATLANGEIFPCSQACHLPVLNKYFNLDVPETHYNIYEMSGDEIAKCVARPCPTCVGCWGMYFDYQGKNWSKSKKEKNEWPCWPPVVKNENSY